MRAFAFLMGLAAFPLFGQDDARLRQLVEMLADDSPEARDQAEKDLVAAGESAIPYLKKAIEASQDKKEGTELRLRATSALRQIEFAVKSRGVYREPRTITLEHWEGPLSAALEAMAKRADVRFDASAIDGRAKVALDVADAPLFRVLDEICRGHEERTYEYRDEGVVKFSRERHVPYPAAYTGPFRVRILKMRLERATDFKENTFTLHLTLDSDYEKYLKPFKRYEVEIAKAADDKGTALDAKPGDGGDLVQQFAGRRIVIRAAGAVVFGADGPEQGREFVLKGLSGTATHVTLQGTVRYSFPLDAREVKFEKPENNASQDCGDYAIKLTRSNAARPWNISFRRSGGKAQDEISFEDVEQRLDRNSVVAIDEDGGEHKGTLDPSRETVVFQRGGFGGDAWAPSYQATFTTLRGGKALKELRFRFVEQVFVKSAPFRFESLRLP